MKIFCEKFALNFPEKLSRNRKREDISSSLAIDRLW